MSVAAGTVPGLRRMNLRMVSGSDMESNSATAALPSSAKNTVYYGFGGGQMVNRLAHKTQKLSPIVRQKLVTSGFAPNRFPVAAVQSGSWPAKPSPSILTGTAGRMYQIGCSPSTSSPTYIPSSSKSPGERTLMIASVITNGRKSNRAGKHRAMASSTGSTNGLFAFRILNRSKKGEQYIANRSNTGYGEEQQIRSASKGSKRSRQSQHGLVKSAKCTAVSRIWSVPDGNKGATKNSRNGFLKPSSRGNSRKPRMPKFLQSFCCCIRPEATIKEKRDTLHSKPSTSGPQSLITQVSRNSANGIGRSNTADDGPTESFATNDEDSSNIEFVPMQPSDKLLLPPIRPCDQTKNCLIIDLDETLVHSSFKPVKNPDFVIPVEIDNVIHQVYVLKRPYVDEFLERIGDKFECVLFTASLAKYADPVADLLDKRGVFKSRLFREACVFHKGNYVKDLTRLGRELKKVIIVDNSPASYAFHPDNAIPVQTWFDDADDLELLDILPLLEQLADVDCIYSVLKNSNDDLRRSISANQD